MLCAIARLPRFRGHDPVGGELEVREGGIQFAEERPIAWCPRT
jgi:hypothetical protein